MAAEEVQELQRNNELEDMEMVEEDGGEGFMITEQLDEETQNLAAGLASRQSDEVMHALHEFLKVLAVPKRGGKVLRQYVLASPKCVELLSAWELGAGAPTAVPLMLLLSEIFRHPQGKGRTNRVDDRKVRGNSVEALQKAKALAVVQSRLDKLARTFGRSKIKDMYSHLSSKQRSRQKAVLRLLSSIVLRGKLLAVDVATNFDFTLEALKKLAQHPFKASANTKTRGLLHQSTRYYFIEFALSFLVVGDPGLLRWILQKRPLYAGLLHGLAKDEEATIIQVLHVFQEKVMAPASLVPAGLQSVLFGDVALEQLARIAGDELFRESADVAYETLMALCTDPSHGLCPEYASPWESVNFKSGAHGGNQGRLLRLLLRLRVTEAFRHRELLLTTARLRPRLAAAYLDAVPYSLEPRPSPTWFTIMSLVADLVHISSTPPPLSSMALRGLPVPAPDGPLVRNNLRHLLPRALPKVALNRGLQHANVLVKHASLRLLLEALLSLELLVDGAFAAAENTCSQLKDRFSGNFSVLETKTRSIKRGDSLRDSEQEFQRRQWLELVESIQDTMRATLPDPNILLIINSTINRRKNSLDEPDGNHKRTQPVKEVSAGKRRKKDEGYVIDEPDRTQLSHSDSSVESEGDEEEEDSSALEILAQIWGSEAIVSANGSIQSLLHAKLLEVLAAYQRVLPVAFADKGFDPFKLLSSDLMQLSLAQQKAFLSLLLATTAASQRNSATNSIVEAGGFGSVYKHSKPLLKMMIGCRVDHIRDNAHLLASRLMVSTGAFESNTWETTLWLGHLSRLIGEPVNTICKLDDSEEDHPNQHILGSIGECVVGFLAEAVSSVGRTLYKYFDELFSLLSAHSLGEGSTEQSKGLSGSMVPEFGPFVVCALEHTLRVVRSDSKSMSLPQRSAIALYVAGVLSDLLRIQTDARALGIVITSILSPEFNPTTRNTDKNLSTLGSEWNPLQVVYLQARSFLDGEVNWATPAMQAPGLKISEPSGHLCDVITTCKESTKDDVVMLKENLVSALVCAPLHNVSNSFFKLVEIIPKTCGQRIPILMTLCGLHCSLLTEADLEFENTEKDRTIKRQLLVTELLSIFSSSSFKMGGLALSDSSSSIGELANHIFYFLKSLPFSVLFSALLYRVNGKLLNFEVLSTTLDSSYSSILAHDQLIIMKTLLSSIHQLSFASLESLDKKQRLDICFTYLKRLVTIPKTSNHGEESNTISEEILLCKDMIIMSLTHPAIAGFCQCSTETEVSSMKHQKSSRLLDACIMDYLKFLLESCSAIELRGKSESLAEMLDSLQGATIQACKPFVQKTMKLFSLKLIGRVSDEDETTFSKDYYLTQSFVLQLAGYADSQYFLSFLSDLVSCKTVRTPSGVSSSSVFLELARAFYEKRLQNGLNNKFKSEHCGAVLQESLDVFRFVGTEVLKDVAEDADRCLLSALQSFSPDAEGGCSSSSSHLSLLVSTAPIEVINCCIQRPTILRGNIVKILVQTSTVHRNEFGRLLCQGTGEDEIENDEASKFASKFLTEKKFQTEKTSFRLSDNDLFLLLPAAKVFLCKCQSSLMTRLVVHVASTYLRLLTTHIKRWDEFVLKLLSFTELGSSVSKLVNKDHSVEELAGSYFKDIVTLMRRCLAICPLSSKKRVYLLRKLLPKAGLPLADLQIDSLIGSEIDLSTVFFQVYGKAAAARHILSDIEAHLPEAYTASSVPKQQKLRSLMADSVMRFATGLASTLTVIFKVAAQMKNQSTSSYTPRTPKVIKALEEFLQLQLVGVVKSIDTTGFEADIMSLFESYAKTCLRYKFGNVEGMKVLQALAGCLLNLPDDYTAKRREIVSSVLELVLSHSQFVLYIVSCSTASRPLPKNLGRQAGKGTALSSLPSILSLIGSPMVVSGKQTLGVASDMQVSSMSEAEGADIDVGIDAPAEVPEECQLALLQLVRSLFQVKMHPGDEILSSEDRATVEELLSLLLAAYGATTGRLDTEIYALMKQLESYGGPGFSGLASMDYLWGEAALQRRKAKVEEKSQLMDEGLEIDENVLESRKRTYKEDLTLDPRRCGLSVLCFPTLAHHSITLGNREVGAKSKKVFLSDTYDADLELQLKGTAYDPRYILQFGLHGIAVKCIDAEEFVCLGLLAVAIASLSSSDEDMRRLGYKLLAKYMSILEEGSTFKGQPQIRMLLNYVKNAVTEEWQQLPFVLMLFAAECSCILMHPENPHFMVITRYLLKGPALDLEYVPLFHSMFGSGSPRHRSERLWMLRLLACGLSTSRDARVFRRQFVLEILMSFYNSPLADSFARKWVLQVLLKSTRVRGCVQALVERSGFLPWLASAVVNYRDISISEQDGKEADDLPIMILEIMERLLRWKFFEQRCLGEGMAELTTAALTLRYFLTHGTRTPKQRAIFRRPAIRIMTYALRSSQRRKKHETHFNLSLRDILEAIRWVESEGPDSGYGIETTAETRALVLHMLLQSSPPAVSTPEDKELLCEVSSWAVPVASRTLVNAAYKQSTGSGHADFKKLPEGLPEKLARWVTASLVIGKLALVRSQQGSATGLADACSSCLNVLSGRQSLQSMDFHPTNRMLAVQLLELQTCFSGEVDDLLVPALASLWPVYNPEEILPGDESVKIATLLIERILSNISVPQEAYPLWRWSFNNSWRSKETAAGGNMPTGISSFEAELCQIALVVFQQLVMAQANSGLAQLVSQWVKGLDISEHDFTCSKKACSKFVEKLDQSIEKLRRTHNQLVTTS